MGGEGGSTEVMVSQVRWKRKVTCSMCQVDEDIMLSNLHVHCISSHRNNDFYKHSYYDCFHFVEAETYVSFSPGNGTTKWQNKNFYMVLQLPV